MLELVRRVTVLIAVAVVIVGVLAMPAAAKLTAKDKRAARARVSNQWAECLAAEGITAADIHAATVRATSSSETHHPIDSAKHRPVIVTLPTGEQFIVHLKPGLTGAATFGTKADATLDAAAATGLDC
jgi:hypothetical protein